jgi:hypothetical protein
MVLMSLRSVLIMRRATTRSNPLPDPENSLESSILEIAKAIMA